MANLVCTKKDYRFRRIGNEVLTVSPDNVQKGVEEKEGIPIGSVKGNLRTFQDSGT